MSVSDSLSQLFDRSRSNSIDWQGMTVVPMVQLAVRNGSRVRVRRLGSSPLRAQALKMAVDSGELSVNGVANPSLALWSHTAPGDLEVRVEGTGRMLDLWNAWSLDGVDNSWLGNAGIIVDEHASGLTLQCSDGVGEPDFGDLVVWVGVTY